MAKATIFELEPHAQMRESGRQALGRFLRARREAIAPEEVGISSRRGRRTPGLRREEVAFLADIGVKWYARLEAGDEIHPSVATLTGIAVALRLSNIELEYMLELSGQQLSAIPPGKVDLTLPESIGALLGSLRGVAATIGDRILTPLGWNDLADTLYGYSRYKLPVERNSLVRSLRDAEFIEYLGSEREAFVSQAVGMFRLNRASQRPSPLGDAVYEAIKDEPAFREAWMRRTVAGEVAADAITIREHAVVGRLAMYSLDGHIPSRADLFLRVRSPADEETAAKFEQLENIGTQRRVRSGSSFVGQLTYAPLAK